MAQDVPRGFTSVVGINGKSIVFYVDHHNRIKRYGQNPKEDREEMASKRNQYDDVQMKDPSNGAGEIITSTKELAAIYFKRDNEFHLRLYYVDASNKVVELAQDLDAADPTKVKRDWYVGDMTKKGYEARPQTSSTAHVNEYEKSASIKVYFFPKDARRTDRPTVAWYDVSKDGKWQILDEGGI
ncbi:hypothetical protein Slin15195_G125410 [Septoria linicola]|uniref:Fucose-specific lectin n=1 Tax=Septoria linicola TaxID=215465 RepID=A0A9Q9EQV5_9PEZI|nr:hypothetical protein Slin14017_G081600 [Septoria linicola]USW59222.1 hypothetical protein Slin15195_G125410 [Septoria linicola]